MYKVQQKDRECSYGGKLHITRNPATLNHEPPSRAEAVSVQDLAFRV